MTTPITKKPKPSRKRTTKDPLAGLEKEITKKIKALGLNAEEDVINVFFEEVVKAARKIVDDPTEFNSVLRKVLLEKQEREAQEYQLMLEERKRKILEATGTNPAAA